MLLLAAAPAAYAEVIDIKWARDGTFIHSGPVAAGKFVEICGKLPAKSKVHWEFEAGVPLEFNIHYHVGKDVMYPAKLAAAAAAKDVLATTSEQEYCWMWTNKSAAPTSLTVKLKR